MEFTTEEIQTSFATPNQEKAFELIKKVLNQEPIKNLYITGHSLSKKLLYISILPSTFGNVYELKTGSMELKKELKTFGEFLIWYYDTTGETILGWNQYKIDPIQLTALNMK